MDIAICGHAIVTPEMHETAKKRNGVLSGLGRLRFMSYMAMDLWQNSEQVRMAQELIERCRVSPVVSRLQEFTSTRELHRGIEQLMDECTRMSNLHTHATRSSIFYQVLALTIMTEGSEDELKMDHYSDIALLLGSCSNVVRWVFTRGRNGDGAVCFIFNLYSLFLHLRLSVKSS